mmetsp:Transcript_752/g.1895  ORF Transcript_752/g.1895 Transcript_752/m.1895 type:complete len:211 (+) Transcript_752:183-815(+)
MPRASAASCTAMRSSCDSLLLRTSRFSSVRSPWMSRTTAAPSRMPHHRSFRRRRFGCAASAGSSLSAPKGKFQERLSTSRPAASRSSSSSAATLAAPSSLEASSRRRSLPGSRSLRSARRTLAPRRSPSSLSFRCSSSSSSQLATKVTSVSAPPGLILLPQQRSTFSVAKCRGRTAARSSQSAEDFRLFSEMSSDTMLGSLRMPALSAAA